MTYMSRDQNAGTAKRDTGLTEEQAAVKWLFCLIMCATNTVLALWAGMWVLAAATAGVLSCLHLALLPVGLLFAIVFWDIATGETRHA